MVPSDVAPTSAQLVRTGAEDAWRELLQALDRHGPVPCQSGDPEWWWPVRTPLPRAAPAVAACRRCGAQRACLAYALAADERFGIWGGTLPEERLALRPRSRSWR
jgi:WhiB family redox-sensing transcriptional regulator